MNVNWVTYNAVRALANTPVLTIREEKRLTKKQVKDINSRLKRAHELLAGVSEVLVNAMADFEIPDDEIESGYDRLPGAAEDKRTTQRWAKQIAE